MKELLKKSLARIDLIEAIKPSIDPEFKPAIEATITLTQIICYGVAVIIMIIMGIQFITAAPDGKARIKEKLVSALVGAIILFAVGSIIKIVGTFAVNNITANVA